MPQRQRAHFLRQTDFMAAWRRSERAATAAEQVDPVRAMPRRAAALLPRELLAGAPDLRAVLDVMGAGSPLGELPDDVTLDQVLARLQPENLVGQRDRTGLFAVDGFDFQFHITRPPARRAWPRPARRRFRSCRPPGGICPASARPCAASSSPHRAW